MNAQFADVPVIATATLMIACFQTRKPRRTAIAVYARRAGKRKIFVYARVLNAKNRFQIVTAMTSKTNLTWMKHNG